MRLNAPLRPRWKQAGEIGTGGDQYVWHDFAFNNPARGSITIQVRVAAGVFDGDGDDDDVRFRLDGTLLGDWNSANAIDGSVLDSRVRTIHIVRRDVATGGHTLRVEADEHPTLLAVNVFGGEVQLLGQHSGLFRWCAAPWSLGQSVPVLCFSVDGDPALLDTTFPLPAGASPVSVLLEGRAAGGDRNLALGYPNNDDDARVLLDGVPLGFYDSDTSLDGDLQEWDLAAVEHRSAALVAGSHGLKVTTLGKPYVDHLALYQTPQFQPLFRQEGGRLSPWSTNCHVIPVTKELLPAAGDFLAPRSLTIELGTWIWSDEFAPPFYHVLLIDSAVDLYRTLTGTDSHSASRSVTAETLARLGVGGRVVVVVGTSEASGPYFVRITRRRCALRGCPRTGSGRVPGTFAPAALPAGGRCEAARRRRCRVHRRGAAATQMLPHHRDPKGGGALP